MTNSLPIVPGRGLVTQTSTQMRLAFLKDNDLSYESLAHSSLDITQLQSNIESYIGTIEIPLGIVGPLLFNAAAQPELVYCAAGTLEGALVASMNRGAKVLSLSGGFSSKVLWQKMCRAPLFIFENEKEATLFSGFVESIFEEIKTVTQKYSNHAQLRNIEIIQQDEHVHTKFVYSTGDASGQNMTTTCTWHAMLFIVEEFKKKTDIIPLDFVIEGNGASDKKISQNNIQEGRGIHVVAECFLPDKIIHEVLRTTAEKMEKCFHPSKKIAEQDGMVGYNINVANSIAAIFVATGQDLASVHESGIGILNLERKNNGLYLQLTLPNLVIGTVGGGTHLPKQAEALSMMGCLGSGKVERFAQLIAGFTLGLEISTYAAIVSGEFAKAHEKLGRNKPVKWLLKSELNENFLFKCLHSKYANHTFESLKIINESLLENGIITNVAGKISKKLMGFIVLEFNHYKTGNTDLLLEKILLKSKPLDEEVIKGLHLIAASIDTQLSDLLKENKDHLEYKNCHVKELDIYAFLAEEEFKYMPKYYGKMVNKNREIYIFLMEYLNYSAMSIVNSENSPEIWGKEAITAVLEVMSGFHNNAKTKEIASVQAFSAWQALPLYEKLLNIIITEKSESFDHSRLTAIVNGMPHWEKEAQEINIDKVVIHNDCNPRNIAIRKNGDVCIYDWELAVVDLPSRDIVEFLSFVLLPDFTKEEMMFYLNYYAERNLKYSIKEWMKAYRYSLKTYIATRVSFYEVSGILIKYEFSERILKVALRMSALLEENE
jgi:hydroxymethylglutaryl-CoA reductase (NADPH)